MTRVVCLFLWLWPPGKPMQFRGRSCLARFGWVGLLSLLTFLLAPAVARAECGDYVHVGQGNSRQHDALSPAATPRMLEAPRPESHTPLNSRIPCSGPNCSQRPSAPPSLPTTPPSPGVEQWLHLTAVLPFQQPQRVVILGADRSSLPQRHSSDIYHPPRSIFSAIAL